MRHPHGGRLPGQRPNRATPLYEYYGEPGTVVNGQPWEVDIAHVEKPPDSASPVAGFLQATAIAYTDLVTLLETQTLNPTLTLMLQAPDGSCDLTVTNLVDTTPPAPPPKPVPRPRPRPLTTPGGAQPAIPAPPAIVGMLGDATLDAFHRFIRLWRKLGWAISDLDKTMAALQATAIDQRFLLSLAAVQQLQNSLSVSLPTVLSFWANLDTDGTDSFYLSLFQNKAVLNPPDPAFQLNYAATLTAAPSFQFPSPSFPNLTYDPSAQTLTALTDISDTELAQLQSLSDDPTFISVLNEIREIFLIYRAFSVVASVTASLAALPSPIVPTWLNYNASASQISFTGT